MNLAAFSSFLWIISLLWSITQEINRNISMDQELKSSLQSLLLGTNISNDTAVFTELGFELDDSELVRKKREWTKGTCKYPYRERNGIGQYENVCICESGRFSASELNEFLRSQIYDQLRIDDAYIEELTQLSLLTSPPERTLLTFRFSRVLIQKWDLEAFTSASQFKFRLFFNRVSISKTNIDSFR